MSTDIPLVKIIDGWGLIDVCEIKCLQSKSCALTFTLANSNSAQSPCLHTFYIEQSDLLRLEIRLAMTLITKSCPQDMLISMAGLGDKEGFQTFLKSPFAWTITSDSPSGHKSFPYFFPDLVVPVGIFEGPQLKECIENRPDVLKLSNQLLNFKGYKSPEEKLMFLTTAKNQVWFASLRRYCDCGALCKHASVLLDCLNRILMIHLELKSLQKLAIAIWESYDLVQAYSTASNCSKHSKDIFDMVIQKALAGLLATLGLPAVKTLPKDSQELFTQARSYATSLIVEERYEDAILILNIVVSQPDEKVGTRDRDLISMLQAYTGVAITPNDWELLAQRATNYCVESQSVKSQSESEGLLFANLAHLIKKQNFLEAANVFYMRALLLLPGNSEISEAFFTCRTQSLSDAKPRTPSENMKALNETFTALSKNISSVGGSPESPCAICHEDMEIKYERIWLVCQHCFHDRCIIRWFETNQTCATCRRKLN